MAEFFETDDVTKGFDRNISRRILSYVKPYKLITILAFVALVVSTAGELLSPVIIRRAIDDALVKAWFGLSTELADTEAGRALKLSGQDPIIGGRIYVRTSRIAGLSQAERQDLIAKGYFDSREMYVFAIKPQDATQASLLAAKLQDFSLQGGWGVLPVETLRTLTPTEAASLRSTDIALVARYVATLLVILASILISTFVMTYFSNLLGLKVMKDLRMQLFDHVLSRSLSFLSRQPVGRLVTRLTSDVETISQFFSDVLSAFIKDASIMAGAMAVLFFFDVRLALVVTASLPLVFFVSNIARRKARDAFRNQRRWTSKVNAYLSEHISGIDVVKLFVREEAAKAKFAEHDAALKKARVKLSKSLARPSAWATKSLKAHLVTL